MTRIETKADYEAALERGYALMDAESGSPEETELVLLSCRIETYEDKHYPANTVVCTPLFKPVSREKVAHVPQP